MYNKAESEVICNGVDPQKFHRVEREHRDRPLVSTVGLIYQLKGQLDLIDATALLKPMFDNCRSALLRYRE